jgi:hypothetical protein
MSFVIYFDLMVDFVVADGGWFEPDAYEAQWKTFGPATSTAAVEKLAKMWHEAEPDCTCEYVLHPSLPFVHLHLFSTSK